MRPKRKDIGMLKLKHLDRALRYEERMMNKKPKALTALIAADIASSIKALATPGETREEPMTDKTEALPPLPTALLDWSLYVDCPKCSLSNNLASSLHDCEHSIAKHIFSNAWDKLKGWEVTCEGCEHEFTIERVEY